MTDEEAEALWGDVCRYVVAQWSAPGVAPSLEKSVENVESHLAAGGTLADRKYLLAHDAQAESNPTTPNPDRPSLSFGDFT